MHERVHLKKGDVDMVGPSPSPTQKRKALGDISSNTRGVKRPKKVVTAGKRGILDSRPLLRDVFFEAV
jgi:hypothetical protein